jgi:hypothetical protein
MKRLVLGCLIGACCLSAPAAAMASAQAPKARTAAVGTDIAGAFAAKLATTGASYLISKLQDGALGSTGKSIGNFLSDAGLGAPGADPAITAIKEELKVVNERLVGLQQEVGVLNTKLDQLGATVSNGNYSILVAFANKLRSAVLTGDKKLREIAAAPVAERRSLAVDFVDFYRRELKDKELEFENYLTGGNVPGAEGILKISSRKARSAAQPFFTHAMSEFAPQVWGDYALVQAVWLEERLNFMHFEHRSVAQMQAAINETNDATGREFRELPPSRIFSNTVLDTRTSLLWSWRIDPSGCNSKSAEIDRIQARLDALLATPIRKRPADYTSQVIDLRAELRASYGAYNQCLYDHGAHAAPGIWDLNSDRTTTEPTNGSPPPGWKRPTVDQIKALDAGASGAVPAWLASRGGFPSSITGEVWASNRSGNNASTVNQTNGAVNNRDINQKHFTLLQGFTVDSWFFVQ